MDPITLITTALVLGVTAGLKPTAEKAIIDMYEGLKTLIVDKYKVHLGALESKPESEVQQAAVAEQIKDLKVDQDEEIIQLSRSLIDAAKSKEETKKDLENVQINLHNNKQFAFSVSGSATYHEK